MGRIKRALVSVSDKTGVVELAQELSAMGIEILSTGGTAKALRDKGVKVKDVSDYTGFPEMMDGRVKTLHPKVHGALLGRRDKPEDMRDMEKHGIEPIDLVVVNLYPFEATISKPGVTLPDAIENIDIGGPTMLRSSAKNWQDVTVLVDPNDYEAVLKELRAAGETTPETRLRLSRKVFKHTSRYDTLIADYLGGHTKEADEFPETLTLTFKKTAALRYGENPHQRAAAYAERPGGLNIFEAHVLQGKEMSFNNYSDTHAALMLALEFERPSCAIIKHMNPCGVAVGDGSADAYVKALKTDSVSAYGGVIAFNTEVDKDAAGEIIKRYCEVVIAPSFSDGALSVFAARPAIRVLRLPDLKKPLAGFDIVRVAGGLLLQEWDNVHMNVRALKAATVRQPSDDELDALEFAWRVVKHVRSNAIVYVLKDRTMGIGIGQTSRIYAARVGAINAVESLEGSVVASDGFFPFPDSVVGIKRVGATAVIQPGGSVKDNEVIEAANELGLAMLMTGIRHFKH